MGGAYGEWTYRAPPGSSRTSGGTALPRASPMSQIYTMYIDFPLHGNTLNLRSQAQALELLEALGSGGWKPWRSPQAPRPFVFLWKKREDDLLEVGIEGVACDVSQRVGVLKKAQFRWLLGQHHRRSLGAGSAATHRSLEVGWRHRRMDTQPCAGRRPKP